ncbi:DUF7674 family protein [Spartinivicinus poritis]|uniref:DUF7674 domain-containing protein n=1 Tax=Spartinivicinus poritis TaxID=2994640 RepID=A0ABT5U8A4_9GAMM|nr:hypothetical protein [Spartinivicinus sp. A2-2]MDE1462420.1 hypothetical protein [Spartinivicinus sp. A2-2]
MTLLEFYNETRQTFPEITVKADKEHIRVWDEIDPEFAYSWFESLAKALNREMTMSEDVGKYIELFNYMSSNFRKGNKEVKNCIDVAFTENLFWQVPEDKIKPYWLALPDELKKLYIDFHRREPI